MKLRTITLFAAIAHVSIIPFQVLQDVRFLGELAKGEIKLGDVWISLFGMPFSLLSTIALSVFLFVLALRQKQE